MQREQKKAEKLIKEAAKRNDMVSCKVVGVAGFGLGLLLTGQHAAAAT